MLVLLTPAEEVIGPRWGWTWTGENKAMHIICGCYWFPTDD
jgi:hypothetical protein